MKNFRYENACLRSTSSLFNEQPPTEFQALISSNKYFNNFSHKRKWAHDRIRSGGSMYYLLVCFAIMVVVVCATRWYGLYVFLPLCIGLYVQCHGALSLSLCQYVWYINVCVCLCVCASSSLLFKSCNV